MWEEELISHTAEQTNEHVISILVPRKYVFVNRTCNAFPVDLLLEKDEEIRVLLSLSRVSFEIVLVPQLLHNLIIHWD